MTSTITGQWTPGCGSPHPETLLHDAINKVLTTLLMLQDTGVMTKEECGKVSTRYLNGMGYEHHEDFYKTRANWNALTDYCEHNTNLEEPTP